MKNSFIRGILVVLGIIFLSVNLAYSSAETLTDYVEAEATVFLSDSPIYLKVLAGNYSDREPEVFLTINGYPIKLENVIWERWATKEKSRFRFCMEYADTHRWDIGVGIIYRLSNIREADFGLAFTYDIPDGEWWAIQARIWREFPVLFKNTSLDFGVGIRHGELPGIHYSLGMSVGL